MSTFECLYLLENFYLSIIEVKRLDVAENAPASDRFLWLRIENESMEISQLTFRSMDAATEIQERYFDEGYLKFNATIGTYIEKYNSAQHPLKVLAIAELPERTRSAIAKYLLALPQTA